jgi:cell division protein FtsN
MPRVVVPTESEERAATHTERRRRTRIVILSILTILAASAIGGLGYYRAHTRKVSADTVFVRAPAWPDQARRQAVARPIEPGKEYLLQVGAYTDKRLADTLAARLQSLPWTVAVVAPLRATDSTNKVIVSGITDRAVARRLADSLSNALKLRVIVLDPPGPRLQP